MNQNCFYRISIKGIVVDDQGRILLAREDNGMWEMLGGGLDHGEKPKDGLRREILEETGLKVTKIADKPSYVVTSKRKENSTYMANIIYEIELESRNFTPSNECQELRFFSIEDTETVELFPNVVELKKLLQAEAAR